MSFISNFFANPNYREVEGDLFSYTGAIAHGCNTQGNMGGGIAKVFATKWPKLEKDYIKQCEAELFVPGTSYPWHDTENNRLIYNLASQVLPGANASYALIEQSVAHMIHNAQSCGIREIAMPAIGAGIGGLKWSRVRRILKKQATKDVGLVVYLLKS